MPPTRRITALLATVAVALPLVACAEDTVADLRAKVEELTDRVPANEERTVAVLYPTVGGGVTYAYATVQDLHLGRLLYACQFQPTASASGRWR